MESVSIDHEEPDVDQVGSRRRLSASLGAEFVALNHYRIKSGEGLPGGIHTHMDQEEVFVILQGEATFETMNGEVTIDEGEAIRFAPGEFQSGKNMGDTELRLLALGAPIDSTDTRIPATCPICSHDNMRIDREGDQLTFVCPDCNSEQYPADCPECGHENLQFTLDSETRIVVQCMSCSTEFDKPPIRS